jgi:hypothetical protein
MVEPIASVAQITLAWLTQRLREGGHLDQGHIVSVEPHGQRSDAAGGPGFHGGQYNQEMAELLEG